jgi:hypothetical protein
LLDISRPRRVIDHSSKIARAEKELCRALLVSIVGDTRALPVDVLVIELAHLYEPLVESLEFHRLYPRDYLLVLPDKATVVVVFNDDHPIQFPPFTVVCRWWSCFKGATGAALPNLVDVELSGVPVHVWELEMIEHLLDEWCWVSNLHLDTVNRRNYAAFQLRAWCDRPELVPSAMDLIIIEPSVQAEELE